MKLRVIPTSVHGALDYATGPVVAAAPELFRLKGVRASALAPRVQGLGATAYSTLTDYELGAKRVIPMRVHLLLDGVGGAMLAATPWLFKTRKHGVRHWLPHTVVGLTEVALALTTKPEPARTRTRKAVELLRFRRRRRG